MNAGCHSRYEEIINYFYRWTIFTIYVPRCLASSSSRKRIFVCCTEALFWCLSLHKKCSFIGPGIPSWRSHLPFPRRAFVLLFTTVVFSAKVCLYRFGMWIRIPKVTCVRHTDFLSLRNLKNLRRPLLLQHGTSISNKRRSSTMEEKRES